jgi:hypothetical protein
MNEPELRREENMEQREKTKAKRRDFLKLVGLGSIAGAAAAATGANAPAAESEARPKGAGYRETPHVKKYYDTARF